MNETAALKITSLQRCVSRARAAYQKAGNQFRSNYDLQDVAVLNVIRACETAIDLANMALRSRHLGIPAENRESFEILQREGHVNAELAQRLKAMVGFRNIAVHQYRDLDFDVVEYVLTRGLDDLLEFGQVIRSVIVP